MVIMYVNIHDVPAHTHIRTYVRILTRMKNIFFDKISFSGKYPTQHHMFFNIQCLIKIILNNAQMFFN